MRISGGIARGIELKVPKGDKIRPATDGMRQALFSSLGERVVDSVFLDLFAGSGGYGLEAISRGAKGGTFVEKSGKTIRCLEANIEAVCKSVGRGSEDLKVVEADATTIPFVGAVPDLVFIDPPYELIADLAPKLFERLTGVLAPDRQALILFEHPGELTLSAPGWTCLKRLGKGARQPTVGIFRREG